MSVPPEVLQQLTAGAGAPGDGAPAAPGGMPGGPEAPGGMPGGPAASPMGKPEPKAGKRAGALANLRIAQNMLEQALTAFDPSEKEYQVTLDCLKRLSSAAGKNDSADLVPAQIMRLVGQMPQMGGGTDMQRAIMQQLRQAPGAQPAAKPGMPMPKPGA